MMIDRDLHRLADLVAARVLEAVRPKEVLTIREAAALMQMSEATVRRFARSGEVPAKKFGDQWRFSRTALLEALTSKET